MSDSIPDVSPMHTSFASSTSSSDSISSGSSSSSSSILCTDSLYSCLYSTMSWITHCRTWCDAVYSAVSSTTYTLYQYIAPYVETIAEWTNIPLPSWLHSEYTQQTAQASYEEYVKDSPFGVVIRTETHKIHSVFVNAFPYLHEVAITHRDNGTPVLFYLYRILNDEGKVVYKRFDQWEHLETWWNSCMDYEDARDHILEDYQDHHEFIQLTPRNTSAYANHDWRETLRAFSIKGNKVMDQDFIEWILHDYESGSGSSGSRLNTHNTHNTEDMDTPYSFQYRMNTLDNHYPITYIDHRVKMGKLTPQHYVVIGEGVVAQ